MTRQSRPQRERMDALAHGINRVSVSARDLMLLSALVFGAGTGAICYALVDDVRTAIGGAGLGAIMGLVYASTLSWDLARRVLTQTPAEQGEEDPFARTGPRTLTRLPDGWTRAQYVHYLGDVLDGATGFNQRDASDYGHSREAFNALVEWVHARDWYEYSNGTDNRNGGEFVAPRETILEVE